MDVFGRSWENYVERIKTNWLNTITENDAVIISGDVSWDMYINEAYEDFRFLNSLPGIKVISKGNHDYWWTTHKKINAFIDDNNFKGFVFLHNNAFLYQGIAVCGCRGWITPKDSNFTKDDKKIYLRELLRLELSIKEGLKFMFGTGIRVSIIRYFLMTTWTLVLYPFILKKIMSKNPSYAVK
jgi:predicted phosphohydrolase